jgi:tetratricopeptide (TPR) repeat protein
MRLFPLRSGLRWARRHPWLTGAALAACVLAGVGGYSWNRIARADHHWHEAQQAIAERDFDRAQAELTAFLELRPASADGHLLLAQTYRRARREDFDQAETHLSEARRLRAPEKAISIEFRQLDYQREGKPDAGESLRQLLDDPDADRRLVFESLARGSLRGDRLDDAAVWLDRWVAAYPEDWYAYLWRGTLFQHRDLPARAVADFDRVLELKPGDADVEYRLGLALVQSGSDCSRAIRYLERHRETHPDDVNALIGIARCKTVLNEPATARQLLKSVLAAHPGHADALLALALADVDLENFPEALQCLREVEPLAAAPPTEEAFQRLLRLEPVTDSRSVPTRLQAVYHLTAIVLRRLNQESQAQAYEEKLRQLDADVAELLTVAKENSKNPRDVALWYRLGVLNLRVGMKDNGEYWLRRLLQVNPNDRRAHRALADYYRGRSDPESQRKADWHERRAGSEK